MDKEETKILTRKRAHASHHETKLFIDWTGITTEQLKTLARRALIYNFQCAVQKDEIASVPEVHHISAIEAAGDHTPIIHRVFAPKVEKLKTDQWPEDKMDTLIERLTPEEKAMLFAELTAS